MILGSVGSGMFIGLAGAAMIWFNGQPLGTVLLAYAVMGSVVTLGLATMGVLCSPSGNRHVR